MAESAARAAYDELIELLRDAGERWVGPARGVTEPDDVGEGVPQPDPHPPERAVRAPGVRSGPSGVPAHRVADAQLHRRQLRRGLLRDAGRPGPRVRRSPAISPARSTPRSRWKPGATDGKLRHRRSAACSTTTTSTSTPTATTRSASAAGRPSATGWRSRPMADASPRATTSSGRSRHRRRRRCTSRCRSPPSTRPRRSRRWDDDAVAAALRRVINHVRGKTVDGPDRAPSLPLRWSRPCPTTSRAGVAREHGVRRRRRGVHAWRPYRIGPDEALVITGRWPTCRFANVCLWNRFSQMYDYVNRQV